ncbi:MAG: UDP-N-acetylglucosamine 1-carboxyvinyltransferase [Planctomycetota bacterium]
MDVFVIRGGTPLSGTFTVNGSKNAALPLMAASLLTDEPLTLQDVPELADTRNMRKLLAELGVESETGDDSTRFSSDPTGPCHARYDIVRTMRASVCVLGPLLARRGEARISMPGGCALGERPIDLHLRGLRALGAEIDLESGDIIARAPAGRLRGATLFLGGQFGSTVLGTANVMSAACLAEGRTIIESAACEPEIVDLAKLLTAMGARIEGAGSPRITIEGVERLGGTTHRVIPDRIEAGTAVCAAAVVPDSEVRIVNYPADALMAFADRAAEAGIDIDITDGTDPMRTKCVVRRRGLLKPVTVTTQPHPGYPTDLQAQLMATLCLAEGHSVVTERIFPERFMHVPELGRMGASISRQGPTAVITGVKNLVGAPVMASDLRASACLVIAGLAAKGETTVNRVYHLDRGYQTLEARLLAMGADIERRDDKTAPVKIGAA